ncbi:hypothetical protein DTO207G8_5633 [Paecilomyces variotii]|nr:hypothetical protein DTO207G8_5633 [Paecilomyces variotii]
MNLSPRVNLQNTGPRSHARLYPNRKPASLWLGHLTWQQSWAADSLPVVVPLCRPQMLLKALRSAIVLPSERNWARIDLPLQLISAK